MPDSTARPRLEVITRKPRQRSRKPPLLFVHGAFMAAWCWDEYFLPYCARRGFDAHALSLRGHGASEGSAQLELASIDDYVADVIEVAGGLRTAPVLIGHSMGGIIAQHCARRLSLPALVLMASVPPQGLLGPAFDLALRDFGLLQEIGLAHHTGTPAAADRALLALFSDRVAHAAAVAYLSRFQPESQRALYDLAWPHFALSQAVTMPVAVLGAEQDAMFPSQAVQSTARAYGCSATIFPGMGHAMMLEPDWRKVADFILEWLGQQRL